MSNGCEGGWAGYPYCPYPVPPPPPPQWPGHHHHHYHHHHHPASPPVPLHQTSPPTPIMGHHYPVDGHLHHHSQGGIPPPCPQYYWDGDDLVDQFGRVVRRKTSANKKERRRTVSINNAFAELRECIPNVPADTKLSKIKTLRLATNYIGYLMDVLHSEDSSVSAAEPGSEGFRTDLSSSRNNNNNSKEEDSDMDTDGNTTTSTSATSPPGQGSNTSPNNASSSQNSCNFTSSGGADKRRMRTGWPETVWAQELKH
ncbi:unnamed protein product, partial [Meganyctiphanes norvegica]